MAPYGNERDMTGILNAFVGGRYGVIPVNVVAPVVSGTATSGQTLSTTNGTWIGVPTPTYTYQWQRGGSNISGATSSSYTLVNGDVGSAIRCVVTATNAVGSASANSNATSAVAAAATAPGAPTIGTATTTGATTATVSYTAPASDGGAAITSYTATSSPGGLTGTLSQAGSGTITVSGLTSGIAYTFTVTATNSVGTSAASGASNSITTYSLPVNTVAPVVSGTATTGYTLTTTNGTWTGTPASFTYSYQWRRAGVNISGATSSSYTLSSLDQGSAVSCVVTATNAGGSTSANSNATSAVVAATTPSAPQNLSVSSITTNSATLSWSEPAVTGGYPITQYTVGISGGGFGYVTTSTAGTSINVSLEAGTGYAWGVVATNLYGPGAVANGPPFSTRSI
jgi:hypothetical protein